jgi:ribonuclease Y
VAKVRQTLSELDATMIEQLAVIAGTTPEAAGNELLETIDQGLAQEAQARLREMEAEAKETAEDDARRLLVDTTQRLTAPIVSESSMSTLPPTERELTRTLSMSPLLEELSERTTAVFALNEENRSIHVSANDPVNRELAKIVFADLLRNGETGASCRNSSISIASAGPVDPPGRNASGARSGCPKLPQVWPRSCLAYRYSYGQNQLTHAVETARLAAMLATELGADVRLPGRVAFSTTWARRSTAT